jgi:tryptophan-rich sensory protein
MKQYVVQLALGDEWHRVFLGEKRIGLGIMVVVSYFIGKVDGILLHILCTSLFSQ